MSHFKYTFTFPEVKYLFKFVLEVTDQGVGHFKSCINCKILTVH